MAGPSGITRPWLLGVQSVAVLSPKPDQNNATPGLVERGQLRALYLFRGTVCSCTDPFLRPLFPLKASV